MKSTFLLLAVLLLNLPLLVNAQNVESTGEPHAVRRVVDAYLAKTDPVTVRRIIAPNAKIISLDSRRGRVVETPIVTPAKQRAGGIVTTPSQRIVAIDVSEEGAMVRVESEFAANSEAALTPRKHIQYISLLKIEGEWKIVGILMPPLRVAETVSK